MPASPSPYERLGGAPAVDELVTAFYRRVRSDAELAPFFARTEMERLLSMQREYVTLALGGPGQLSETRLRDAHAGRGIRGRHFVRFLDLFLDTLRDRGLDEHDIDRIIDRMAIASTDVLDDTSESG